MSVGESARNGAVAQPEHRSFIEATRLRAEHSASCLIFPVIYFRVPGGSRYSHLDSYYYLFVRVVDLEYRVEDLLILLHLLVGDDVLSLLVNFPVPLFVLDGLHLGLPFVHLLFLCFHGSPRLALFCFYSVY